MRGCIRAPARLRPLRFSSSPRRWPNLGPRSRALNERDAADAARRSVEPMVVGESTTPRVGSPPLNVNELQRQLAALRSRYHGAIFDRYLDRVPSVDSSAHICAGAAIIGDVRVAAGASVWYGVVLRGGEPDW